ncbi:MAG: GDYXXLXY domain-containing protein [Myxococcota bacterium]
MTHLRWLMVAIALQLGVLAMEYLGSVWPLWTGEEVRLEIAPVDPRSLFRGNYARLAYTVASVESGLFEGPGKRLRKGEVVYVFLEEGENEVWHATRVQLEPPLSGLFLRGRLTQTWAGNTDPLRIRYGIEAWFAPKEKALEIERATRRRPGEEGRAYAIVSVAGSGRAALARLDLP